MNRLLRLVPLAVLCLSAGGTQVPQDGVSDDPPSVQLTLTLPSSARTVRITWRQYTPELGRFLASPGIAEKDLRRLQVAAVLGQDGSLNSETSLRLGARTLPPGRYPLGFTVGAAGLPNFFVVDGQESWPVAFEEFEPSSVSPRLTMQLLFVSTHELIWEWRLGEAGGRLRLGLDWPEAAAWPPTVTPIPPDHAPRR
ncbi:MAG: hypothetical protein ACT4PU_04715 [Planctomycetota bacterium]